MGGSDPVRVVILGGGFAGVAAARELTRRSRDSRVEVHLVSQENYFVFQPLLPEVVACGIEPSHILNPIRRLCPNARFHCAAIQAVDLTKRVVTLAGSDAKQAHLLPYDHLIVGLGLRMDLSRTPGMTEHSLPLKTLGDAFQLRNHLLRCFEDAELEEDEARRRRLLTVIAVGGGFSGVETIGAIHDMMKSVIRWYPRAQSTGCRTILIHSRDRLLQELTPELGEFACATLQRRGVEVRLKTSVKEATPQGVTLSTGDTLGAGTVICTVGNSPHELIRAMNLPQEQGRLLVDETLRVRGQDRVWAIGDNALVPDVARGGSCPPTAQYAMRQGIRCARNILAAIDGRPLQPFSFGGFGQLAAVGHHAGVGRLMGINVSGLPAWFLWRSVYLAKIPGLRNKVQIGLDWLLEWLFARDITMMDVRRTTQLRRAHYRPGEVIFHQGDLGDHFYILQSGEVEILQTEDGGGERRLAIRSAGESFGELALLKGIPRTSTVRCMTAVDVIMLTRQDFSTLVGSSKRFKTQMDQEVAALSHPPDEPQ
jgi:NADH dehydrogenase